MNAAQIGYNGRVTRKKFFINETNRKKRHEFAREYIQTQEEYWKDVIFLKKASLM